MVVRTLPDERYGSPALRGALCQLNESAQNASQMPPRHACAALRCGACDGAAFCRVRPQLARYGRQSGSNSSDSCSRRDEAKIHLGPAPLGPVHLDL